MNIKTFRSAYRGLVRASVLLIMTAVLGLAVPFFDVAGVQAAAPGTVGSWTDAANSLPTALEEHASVTYNGYVYVFGGAGSGGAQDAVYYAPLSGDGSVGTWTTSPNSLPQGLEGPTAVVNNGYVYVAGGFTSGFNRSPAVYYAQLNGDGSVGSWTTSPNSLPAGLDLSSSVVHNGYIYVMGGYATGGQTNAVYYAPLNGDGSVGSWTTSPNSLPQAVYSPTAVVNDGYVYVMGGYASGGPIDGVYYAPLNGDGSVGSWTTSPNSLPQALDAAGSVVYDGFVYVIGGFGSGGTLQTVYYAPLNSDGSVGSWITSSNSLPQPLQFESAVSYNGYVYVLGGSDGEVDVNNVYYAPITGPAVSTPAATTAAASTGTVAGAPDTGSGSPVSHSGAPVLIILASIVALGAGIRLRVRSSNIR